VPWQPTGEYIRADPGAGESLKDKHDEEWLQSPYVVKSGGRYHMFYGGHGSGEDADGRPVPQEDPRGACQICLMVSADGRAWTRHRGPRSYSRLFVGPGEARDPCVICVGDQWIMYCAGYHENNPTKAGFYARTSQDLVDWSGPLLVHLDPRFGPGPWDTECPHVVFRAGQFYLFRTEDYASARSHVFRSRDPFDFGIGDARDKYVAPLSVAAPEVIVDRKGREYITSNHRLREGTMICRLRWEPA
jgi:beta-fructofuranosidase